MMLKSTPAQPSTLALSLSIQYIAKTDDVSSAVERDISLLRVSTAQDCSDQHYDSARPTTNVGLG